MNLLEFVKHYQITGAGWYWIIWFFGGFGVYETWGLIFDTKDTLSWQFWGLEHINFSDPWQFSTWPLVHWIIAALVTGLLVWLEGHIVVGIWK